MTRSNQKDVERYWIRKFCDLKGIRIESKDLEDAEDRENPDIILSLNNQKIGIEVTDFYRKDGNEKCSEQKQKPLRDSIISHAQKIFEKKFPNTGVEASFGFRPIENKKRVAEKIANLIAGNYSQYYDALPLDCFEDIPELEFVYINKERFEDTKWRSAQSISDIGQIKLSHLQKIICSKEKKLGEYEKCDLQWLLIVVNFMNLASDVEISNVDYSSISIKGFDCVFIMKSSHGQLIELKKKC